MSRADRQRRYRQRQRRGAAVYRVTADDQLLSALIRSHRLTEAETASRERIEQEAAAVLAEWAARWA